MHHASMGIIHKPLPYGAPHQTPQRIIVHAMGEYIQDGSNRYSAFEWLDHLGLSAHALITPDGDIIVCRNDDQGAYHARGFNNNSLGVEFLVPGVHDYTSFLGAIKSHWVTPEQYEPGIGFVKKWAETYSIDDIKRHCDVSPGRKVDPGEGFPWDDFIQQVSMVTQDSFT